MKQNSILLVEDNADLREILASNLQDYGFHVIESDSVQPLVKDLPFLNISAAILDLVLGGASGASLLGYIKAHPRLKNIKVILISGYDHGEEKARQWGADAFLSKPFSTDELISTLRMLGLAVPLDGQIPGSAALSS